MYRGTLNTLDRLIKTFSIFLPPSPCHLENKMRSTDCILYTIYSYEKKKTHMYQGTLNILDMLRKTFFTWTEFFLGDMFFF